MNKKKIQTLRLHDDLYLNENRYNNPKEIFIFLTKIIKKIKFNYNNIVNIGDIGCSNGELSYNLKKNFPEAEITGYDILKPLILKARKKVKNVKFFTGSVLSKNLVKKNKFDVTLLSGVLSIFDSFELPINNLIRWTKPSGKILIFAFFNNFPLDVNIKFSKSENWLKNRPKFWESGYNVFSKNTISNFLKNHKNVKKFKFYDFTMKNNLKINHNDYLRSWTFNSNKKKLIMNGTNLLHPFAVLEIDLKR